jgi:hypothetical protein
MFDLHNGSSPGHDCLNLGTSRPHPVMHTLQALSPPLLRIALPGPSVYLVVQQL